LRGVRFNVDFFHLFIFLSPREQASRRASRIVWVDNWFRDVRARLRQ